jgi:hypothetical protein
LKKIIFNDFGQFYGEQEIEFATDPERSVTLIRVENGADNKSVSGAILWALFGEANSKFEQNNSILNFRAVKEKGARAAVKLLLSINDDDYLVERDYFVNGKVVENFKVVRLAGGNLIELREPEVFIHSVLPKELAGYFFLDGESAAAFSTDSNKASKAFREILGLGLAEIAINDLKRIAAELRSEISNVPEANELLKIEDQLNALDRELGKFTVNARIVALQTEFIRLATESKLAASYLAKYDLAVQAVDVLQLYMDADAATARRAIQESVNDLLKGTSRRNCRFNLSKNFSLELFLPDGTLVPRTRGDNQLLGLFFISALINSGRSQAKEYGNFITSGTAAPLVINWPFEQMDSQHRQDMAKIIARMAPQIVLLVESRQLDDKVLAALEPYTGSEYVLVGKETFNLKRNERFGFREGGALFPSGMCLS